MKLLGIDLLTKFLKKNRGKLILKKSVDKLKKDFKDNNWKDFLDLKNTRPDADKVYNDEFIFFNIGSDRTMILVDFAEEEAEVVWIGTHDNYTSLFNNNKATIKKWLKKKGLI